ncbi:glycosyl hydrolase family 39 [Gelidibacter algens]|uniref:Glycosyl hydrolase family 39 n=1 Tax=Gelidibacter algens TaxID=49280 RepID=A0A327SG43_9FLAO|nr:glycoside hydrolase family 44 protein [Gelidibacter algens]RAJ28070.1 glycosyl hydrolase family 39 [Gelidibacter algens]
MQTKKLLFLTILLFVFGHSKAQFIDSSIDRVKTPLEVKMKRIGSIKPKSTKEITSSRLTVGCETLDRDHTVWDNYKDYLAPLGVKKIRLQAGWAKCEKVPGVYDWKWLDDIIDYAVANDIEPWLQPSYGNPAYPGGGGINLLNSLMQSDEAYAAWDRWVEALVSRYKDRVKEWEIWNEPDLHGHIDAETSAKLNIRTAEIIKRIQPEAKIAGLAFASNSNQEYLDQFLKVIADAGKLDLFHWISYHSYTLRPEDAYSNKRVLGLRSVIEKYSDKILLRQGENGAPSTYIPSFALSEYYWTEYTQAKYNMRRLLGDLGHDIETSVFTIIDIYYNWGDRAVLNTKGLIQSDITMAAIRPKVAYYAVQNIAAIFDSNMVLTPGFKYSTTSNESLSVYGYRHNSDNTPLVALWLDGENATNSFNTTTISITLENTTFKSPVWVDLMTGSIYDIEKAQWSKSGGNSTFNIPLYDSPILITEKAFLIKK